MIVFSEYIAYKSHFMRRFWSGFLLEKSTACRFPIAYCWIEVIRRSFKIGWSHWNIGQSAAGKAEFQIGIKEVLVVVPDPQWKIG